MLSPKCIHISNDYIEAAYRCKRDSELVRIPECLITKGAKFKTRLCVLHLLAWQSVCVFSRGMRKAEFNNAAGKWRRVSREVLGSEKNFVHTINNMTHSGGVGDPTERDRKSSGGSSSLREEKNISIGKKKREKRGDITLTREISLDIFPASATATRGYRNSTEPCKRSNLSPSDFHGLALKRPILRVCRDGKYERSRLRARLSSSLGRMEVIAVKYIKPPPRIYVGGKNADARARSSSRLLCHATVIFMARDYLAERNVFNFSRGDTLPCEIT